LLPNPDIQLLDEDPTYAKDSDIPLSIDRQPIRAVLSNDRPKLVKLVSDVKNLYSLDMQRSPHVKRSAFYYALVEQNLDFLKLITKERKDVTATRRQVDISRKNTGR
jgi:hypothetical protein